MNKVFRLLGSATLATGLVLGGSAGIASANDGRDDHRKSSYDRDNNRNRHDDKRHHDSRNHNNDYKYLYRCFDRRDHRWEWELSYKYDDRKNCYLVAVYKRH